MDSGKQALSKPHVEEVVVAKPVVAMPVVATVPIVATTSITTLKTDHVSQEAYVTDTSRLSAHGPEPITADQLAPGAASASASKAGPFTTIRNFFKGLFNTSPPRQKSSTTVATTVSPQVTETTTTITKTTVATNNPRSPTS